MKQCRKVPNELPFCCSICYICPKGHLEKRVGGKSFFCPLEGLLCLPNAQLPLQVLLTLCVCPCDFLFPGTNLCSNNNGDCSQLCLPTSKSTRACMCTAGYSLRREKQSCEGAGRGLDWGSRGIKKTLESCKTVMKH